MLDSIHVGMTGLQGYARGLRVVANNTANLNTPGFKASTLQFSDLFYTDNRGGGGPRLGHGLGAVGTQVDFRAGDLRQTGNEFDLGLEGEGMFMLRTPDGEVRATRAGQFAFDADGRFVNRADGSQVLGLDAAGHRTDITVAGLRTVAGKASSNLRFTGNLSSTLEDHTVSGLKVFDGLGEERTLELKFSKVGADAPNAWKVELFDRSTSLGTARLAFSEGLPQAEGARPKFSWHRAGHPAAELTLDFSSDVTSFASGTLATLALSGQDGKAPGNLTRLAFDTQGVLVATYSNGETVQGARLLLGRSRSVEAIEQRGDNQFAATRAQAWDHGAAGDPAFGTVRSGVVEVSNVDLSREFSDLVVLQRGYQASSQVIATANDMLQELFRMKSK